MQVKLFCPSLEMTGPETLPWGTLCLLLAHHGHSSSSTAGGSVIPALLQVLSLWSLGLSLQLCRHVFCQLCGACPRKPSFLGEAVSSQTSKPVLTAMQFSGGHGCSGHCVRWKHRGLRLWRKRGFTELQCKLETQCFPVFCIFLLLFCCSLLGNVKNFCSVINVTNGCVSPRFQSCPGGNTEWVWILPNFFLNSQSSTEELCSETVPQYWDTGVSPQPALTSTDLVLNLGFVFLFQHTRVNLLHCFSKKTKQVSICTVNFRIFSPEIVRDPENLCAERTGGALISSLLLLPLIFKLPQWTVSVVEKVCNVWSWFKYYISPLMDDRKTFPFPRLLSSNPQKVWKHSHSSLELLHIDCWIQNDLHILISRSSCLPNLWHWDQNGVGVAGSDLWKLVPQRFNPQWLPVNF